MKSILNILVGFWARFRIQDLTNSKTANYTITILSAVCLTYARSTLVNLKTLISLILIKHHAIKTHGVVDI